MAMKELNDEVTRRMDAGFLVGSTGIDAEDLLEPFGADYERLINIDDVRVVIDEAMSRYRGDDRTKSDAWLGPRLHAALRLTRREAARRGVWRYLAVVIAPDYVRWRWDKPIDKDDPDCERTTPIERFVGPDNKHALGRLWWMAELFRNGPDYSPAEHALTNQDITNNLFRMDVAHHRPVAVGAASVLVPDGEAGSTATGRDANALAKALNAAATTLVLDIIAPDEPLDEAAREGWIREGETYDPTLHVDGRPEGPNDPSVPEASLSEMTALLRQLLAEAPVRGQG